MFKYIFIFLWRRFISGKGEVIFEEVRLRLDGKFGNIIYKEGLRGSDYFVNLKV